MLCYSCLPEVRIAEVHPCGRYIKLRNTSKTKVSNYAKSYSTLYVYITNFARRCNVGWRLRWRCTASFVAVGATLAAAAAAYAIRAEGRGRSIMCPCS